MNFNLLNGVCAAGTWSEGGNTRCNRIDWCSCWWSWNSGKRSSTTCLCICYRWILAGFTFIEFVYDTGFFGITLWCWSLITFTGVLTFFTRVQVESSNSQFFWVDKLSFNAQTTESFTNSQVFNSLSKCKVAMLKARYQRGMTLNKCSIMTVQKHAGKCISLGSTKWQLKL